MTTTSRLSTTLSHAALSLVAVTIAALLFTACTTDAYESGEGRYSHLTAEFGMAHTAAKGEIDAFTTDGSRSLRLNPHAKASWATTPDSLYRSLLYFYDNENDASPFSISQVMVIKPTTLENNDIPSSDPLTLVSAWPSADGKWLNMRLDIKTGKTDDPKAVHNLRMVRLQTGDDSYRLRIVHSRNNMPEYYTSTAYVSIAVDDEMKGKAVELSANTYDGEKILSVEIP